MSTRSPSSVDKALAQLWLKCPFHLASIIPMNKNFSFCELVMPGRESSAGKTSESTFEL
jgi:hypothetical protein